MSIFRATGSFSKRDRAALRMELVLSNGDLRGEGTVLRIGGLVGVKRVVVVSCFGIDFWGGLGTSGDEVYYFWSGERKRGFGQ